MDENCSEVWKSVCSRWKPVLSAANQVRSFCIPPKGRTATLPSGSRLQGQPQCSNCRSSAGGPPPGAPAANDQKVVPQDVHHVRLALRSGPGEGPGLEGHQNQRAEEEEDRAGGPEQPLGDGPPRPGGGGGGGGAAHADQAVA